MTFFNGIISSANEYNGTSFLLVYCWWIRHGNWNCKLLFDYPWNLPKKKEFEFLSVFLRSFSSLLLREFSSRTKINEFPKLEGKFQNKNFSLKRGGTWHSWIDLWNSISHFCIRNFSLISIKISFRLMENPLLG